MKMKIILNVCAVVMFMHHWACHIDAKLFAMLKQLSLVNRYVRYII